MMICCAFALITTLIAFILVIIQVNYYKQPFDDSLERLISVNREIFPQHSESNVREVTKLSFGYDNLVSPARKCFLVYGLIDGLRILLAIAGIYVAFASNQIGVLIVGLLAITLVSVRWLLVEAVLDHRPESPYLEVLSTIVWLTTSVITFIFYFQIVQTET